MEKDAALKATEAARKNFVSVINDLKKLQPDATTASQFIPVDFGNSAVTKFNENVVSKSSTTNNCSLGTTIHEPPEEFYEVLIGDFTNNVTNKMLYQGVIKGSSGEESVVVYWSFMFDVTKSCELALRFKKVDEGEGEIRIEVESVEKEELDVEMSLHYFPPEKGERSIGTGKAVGVVDCSAEEVAAWAYDYCNNERTRISIEERHPARLELREKARVNESTMATIKKFPFLLLNYRKFVFRQVCKSEEGKVFIAFESVHDEVDYGTSRKKVSGLTKGLYYVEHLSDRGGARRCRLTLVQTVEFGGSIPTWVVNKLAPQALGAIQDVIDEFT